VDTDSPHAEKKDEGEALRLEYEYIRNENVRLRDGRASLTRQLGPLPISAAVVAGLVTGFTETVNENAFLWLALSVFGVLVIVSILYSGMKPYRALRRETEKTGGGEFVRSETCPAQWYKAAIALEKAIYGVPYEKDTRDGEDERDEPHERARGLHSHLQKLRSHLPKRHVRSLQEGYDRERSGLFIVQGLFGVVVILLIVSRIT
jgi:hypothetical protein